MTVEEKINKKNLASKDSFGLYKYNPSKSGYVLTDYDPLCIISNPDDQDVSVEGLDRLSSDPVSSLPLLKDLQNINKQRGSRFDAYIKVLGGPCDKFAKSLKTHSTYLTLAKEQRYNFVDRQNIMDELDDLYSGLAKLLHEQTETDGDVVDNKEARRADLIGKINDKLINLRGITSNIAIADAQMSAYVGKIPEYRTLIQHFYLGNSGAVWSGYPNITTLITQDPQYTNVLVDEHNTKNKNKAADELCILHLPPDVQSINPNDVVDIDVSSVSGGILQSLKDNNYNRKHVFGVHSNAAQQKQKLDFCVISDLYHNDYMKTVGEQYENLKKQESAIDNLIDAWRQRSAVEFSSQNADEKSKKAAASLLSDALDVLKHTTIKVAKTDSLISKYIGSMPEYANKVKAFHINASDGEWSGAHKALSYENEQKYYINKSRSKGSNTEEESQSSLFYVYLLIGAVIAPFWAYVLFSVYSFLFTSDEISYDTENNKVAGGTVGADKSALGCGCSDVSAPGMGHKDANMTISRIGCSKLTDAYAQPADIKQATAVSAA